MYLATVIFDLMRFTQTFLTVFCCCLVTQWCLTLHKPMACSRPSSAAHGISQAKILEWVAVSFSRGSSQPRNWKSVSVGSLLLSHKSYISSLFFLPVFFPPILVLPTYCSNNKSLQAYHSIALISSPPPSPLSLFHQWQTLTFPSGLPQSSLLFQSSSSSIHGRKITVSSRLL